MRPEMLYSRNTHLRSRDGVLLTCSTRAAQPIAWTCSPSTSTVATLSALAAFQTGVPGPRCVSADEWV
jgi:hypothetical protein